MKDGISIEILIILKGLNEKLYVNNFDNVDEMNKLFEKHYLFNKFKNRMAKQSYLLRILYP